MTDTTGVIMASGEGSRLRELTQKFGVPKHLLPLGNTTSIELLINDLKNNCNQIIIACSEHEVSLFQEKLQKFSNIIEIIPKKETGFKGDYKVALDHARNDHIILTVGDIIFEKSELDRLIKDAQNKREKFTLTFDKAQIKQFDFRMVMASTNKKMLLEIMHINPESFWAVLINLTSFVLKGKIRTSFAGVLFNLNTPISYNEASSYFQQK